VSLFQEIRDASRDVADHAQFVRVDRAALQRYVLAIPSEDLAIPKLDPSRHFLDHGADTAAFIVTLDSINFGSGWFPHLKKRPGNSGYFTVASALTDLFRSEGVLSASRLAHLTAAECTRIFAQDPGNSVAQELMERFAAALNDLGRLLIDSYGGSFTSLIESAEHSAEQLVRLLSATPFFDDVAEFRGRRVPFYKRAQLTAADLSLAFEGQGWGRFDDLRELTIFADNLVPHVLRMDGVLLYEPGLAVRIDSEELIPAGSQEEVEIRAGALHAVELMVGELLRTGRPATAMGIDFFLWNRGQLPSYKLEKPRHRTRTVFY
jgi:Potential Queuosine, Q, salvage protein family